MFTYSLHTSSGRDFYQQLSKFTDKLLKESDIFLGKEVQGFAKFYAEEFPEKVRHEYEYLVEYIALGIFIEKYASYSINSGNIATSGIEYLYQLRKKSQTLKPFVDNIRGVLSAHLLYKKSDKRVSYTKETVFRLLSWMKASGEFKEETERLSQWAFYLSSLNDADVVSFIARNLAFAKYFEEQAAFYLGEYTKGVNQFLSNEHKAYKYREDYLFCGRSEAEYHLNMFGAEVLNRILKPSFDETKNKVLLLPTCMASPENGACKAVKNGERVACSGCSRDCRINQLKKEMQQKGIETFLIPHSSSFSKFLKYWENQKETGLIGVACVLNLLMGGYEMQRLNIPSQCIFLEYSGCKKHWHPIGIPTDIDSKQLNSVISQVKTETVSTNA